MNTRTLCAVFLQIALLSIIKAEDDCWYQIKYDGSLQIQCPRLLHRNKGIVIIISKDVISIQCLHGFNSEFTSIRIPKFEIVQRRKYIELQDCPLPDGGFKNLYQWLGVVNEPKNIEFLGYKQYLQLTDELRDLQNLEQISLKNIEIKSFENLPKLDTIQVTRSIIKLNAELIKNIPHLKSLDLRFNNISEIPDGVFKHIKMLEELSLAWNKLTILGNSSFYELANLKILLLSNNNLKTIDQKAFQRLENVTLISLSSNNLETISPNLFKFNMKLKKLFLDGNNLISFKGFSHKLLQLELLDLSYCGLQSLDEHFLENLPNLKILLLNSNSFTTLPNYFFETENKLEKIDLSDNEITFISHETSVTTNLPAESSKSYKVNMNLKKLSLDHNYLDSFKGFLYNMTQLEILDLSFCGLQSLDKDFMKNLPNLKILLLSSNNLATLSSNIFKPGSKLEKIYLSNNNISFISNDTFSANTNLKTIDLSHNKLNSETLRILTSKSPNLTYIDFSHNEVRYIDFQLLHNLNNGNYNLKVDLTSNEIESVDLRFLQFIKGRRVFISLDIDSILCECFNLNFFKYVQDNSMKKSIIFGITRHPTCNLEKLCD